MKLTYEIRVILRDDLDEQRDLAKALIATLGYPWTQIIEMKDLASTSLGLYFSTRRAALSFQKKIQALRSSAFDVCWKELLDEDWKTKWKADFRSFDIGRGFRVVPVWERDILVDGPRIPILIDTGFAFGTGMHETTRFMIEFIERCRGKIRSFLDLGIGTGILTVVGYQCGAMELLGVDISPDAVRTARQNLKLNGIPSTQVLEGDLHTMSVPTSFDFVAANILTRDLIQSRRRILKMVKRGGFLAISGVSRQHYSELRQAYRSLPLRCLKVEKGETWTACLFRKEM